MYICNFIYWFSEKNSKNTKPIQETMGGGYTQYTQFSRSRQTDHKHSRARLPLHKPFQSLHWIQQITVFPLNPFNQETLRAGHWKKPVPSLHTLCGSFWAFDPNGRKWRVHQIITQNGDKFNNSYNQMKLSWDPIAIVDLCIVSFNCELMHSLGPNLNWIFFNLDIFPVIFGFFSLRFFYPFSCLKKTQSKAFSRR